MTRERISYMKKEIFYTAKYPNVKKLNKVDLDIYEGVLGINLLKNKQFYKFVEDVKNFMRNYYIENVCERNQQENKEYKEETNKNETELVRYRELQDRNEDEPNYFMDLVENKKINNNIIMPTKKELLEKAKILKTKNCPSISKMNKKELENYIASKEGTTKDKVKVPKVEKIKKKKVKKHVRIKIKKPKKKVEEKVEEEKKVKISSSQIKIFESDFKKYRNVEEEEYDIYQEWKEQYDDSTSANKREKISNGLNKHVNKMLENINSWYSRWEYLINEDIYSVNNFKKFIENMKSKWNALLVEKVKKVKKVEVKEDTEEEEEEETEEEEEKEKIHDEDVSPLKNLGNGEFEFKGQVYKPRGKDIVFFHKTIRNIQISENDNAGQFGPVTSSIRKENNKKIKKHLEILQNFK